MLIAIATLALTAVFGIILGIMEDRATTRRAQSRRGW